MWRSLIPLTHLWLFLQPWTPSTAKRIEPVYKAVGGRVQLGPLSVTGPIHNITWRHGVDVAVEWDGEKTLTHQHFRGRSWLNISTGALTITGLTRNDSGSFSSEVNNESSGSTQLLVISPVSKPTVSTWCDPEMNYCVFTCEGNTSDAEPIQFEWGASDMYWGFSNTHNITKDDPEPTFRCFLENPVSYKSSDLVRNPLYKKKYTFIIVMIIVAAVPVILCVYVVILLVLKRKGVI